MTHVCDGFYYPFYRLALAYSQGPRARDLGRETHAQVPASPLNCTCTGRAAVGTQVRGIQTPSLRLSNGMHGKLPPNGQHQTLYS